MSRSPSGRAGGAISTTRFLGGAIIVFLLFAGIYAMAKGSVPCSVKFPGGGQVDFGCPAPPNHSEGPTPSPIPPLIPTTAPVPRPGGSSPSYLGVGTRAFIAQVVENTCPRNSIMGSYPPGYSRYISMSFGEVVSNDGRISP